MHDPTAPTPPLSDRSGVTDAVRTQILATEHWSLLATRSMTWNEIFSRTSMYLTVLSAAVVALALVAQATAFGMGFRIFALVVLPVVLLVGIMTQIRLYKANGIDVGLVMGMNRLRRAYMELAPELQPYFVTPSFDDMESVMRAYGPIERVGLTGFLEGTPTLVSAINIVLVGVLGALIAQIVGLNALIVLLLGVGAALLGALGHAGLAYSIFRATRQVLHPRFPAPLAPAAEAATRPARG